MDLMYKKRLLLMALYAGEIMLKNGAETYRVEDTIIRLCKSKNFPYVEAYVTPTGIFVSIDNEGNNNEDAVSYIKRIQSRSINLNKITQVNDFSRKFVDGSITLEDSMHILKEIDLLKPYPFLLQAFCGGLASAFFALMFGCNISEFFSAFFTSILIIYSLKGLSVAGFNTFVTNISGGFIASVMAIFFSYLFSNVEVNKVIIGAIMVMVPGVAITNAVRDSIAGDLVSGLARGAEALLIAVSIAFGVGFVLKIWIFITGGTLL